MRIFVNMNNFSGCLFFLILFFILVFILKNIVVIALVLAVLYLIFYAKNQFFRIKSEQTKTFNAKSGETYKICPVCGNQAPRHQEICVHCGYHFE